MARRSPSRPLPADFLRWQVELRRHTALERNGAPHAGVAPILCVRRDGVGIGTSGHSIICGLLPAPDRLDEKTKEFRQLYENGIENGARSVYDRGIEYLKGYYTAVDDFDAESITTLLPSDLPVVDALRADPRCSLLFYVFDLVDKTEVGRFRCLQLNGSAEVLQAGPVYENVWWHNALFHGFADECAVIHFRHETTFDTRFGAFERLES